ncbi:MAG TPA: hypothetical protein DCM87_19550 [Planctomycetes bacterium]|nr:hypothetical protein [Planctomycetota bacterium]
MIARYTLMTLAAASLTFPRACAAADAGEKTLGTPELIAILKSDAALFEKAQACRQLAGRGAREAVPALAPLLGDEKLAAYARDALEKIDDPAAGDALRAALGALKGKLLAGAVNSIGVRGDAQAVSALSALALDPASGAAPEALPALGRIATPEALETLAKTLASGPAELRPAAAEGCILGAERHAAKGARDAAIELYDAVRRADVPAPLRAAATCGTIVVRGSAGLQLLFEALKSDDDIVRGAVLGLLRRELRDPEVTRALAAELGRLRPALQALLIPVLADRDDPGALGAVEAAAASEAEEVRAAALAALRDRGDPKALAIVAARARDAEARVRADAVRVLGEWRNVDAGPVLLALAEHAGDDRDALRAFGAIAALVRRIDFAGGRARARWIDLWDGRALAREALAAAQSDDEKRPLIDALGAAGDAGAFALLGELFDTPSLREDACKAAVAVAERIVRIAPDEVEAAMKKVMAATRHEDCAGRAAKAIGRAREEREARAKAK